jgi:SAM-dependent methyltransferase
MSIIELIHGGYIHRRRVQVLSKQLAGLLPPNTTVLDVGCGDGLLAKEVMRRRPDVAIVGIDPLVRDHCLIPVQWFDGKTIPKPDASCELVMFVDVLHHTENPMVLLREARRVASKAIIIKDHTCNGLLARPTLRLMDWVGNHRHGVDLPYNYWEKSRWRQALGSLEMEESFWEQDLGLYPPPASWVFERSLHFLCYWSCPGSVDGQWLSGPCSRS